MTNLANLLEELQSEDSTLTSSPKLIRQAIKELVGEATLVSQVDVLMIMGWSRATLFRRMATGNFPRPANGRGEKSQWRLGELAAWSKALPPREGPDEACHAR